jgi:hypothetical protein
LASIEDAGSWGKTLICKQVISQQRNNKNTNRPKYEKCKASLLLWASRQIS